MLEMPKPDAAIVARKDEIVRRLTAAIGPQG